MNFIKTDIKDVIIIEPNIFEDSRGHFYESYNKKVFKENGIDCTFVQDNRSKSSYGVIRGLHCQLGQNAQAKLVCALEGEVLAVAVDVRKGSETFGQHIAIELSGENKRQMFIPRGFLHGFSVLSESAVYLYKCDNFYCKEAEFGVKYNDKSLNIDWKIPESKVLLSEKDSNAASLEDYPNE